MLRNLSAYGWISLIIIGLLGAIFMGIAANGPSWRGYSISYENVEESDDDANTGGDDDSYGANDECFYYNGAIVLESSFLTPYKVELFNYFPAKTWFISLSNGLCFSKVPSADTTYGSSGLTYGSSIPSDSFTDVGAFSCWGWDSKIDGTKIFSDDGVMNGICEGMQSYGEFLNADFQGTLKCSNWQLYANRYKSAASAAKAGIFFGVCGIVFGLAGAIMAGRSSDTVKLAIQGSGGVVMIFLMIMCFIVISQGGDDPNNPYTSFNNLIGFGCFAGWMNTQYYLYFPTGPGQLLSIACLIMTAAMGGICLTTNMCYNPCCCPCCFAVVDPQVIQTGTVVGTQMQNNNNGVVNVGVKV